MPLTDNEILNTFADAPCGSSNREYLLTIGRAIEAKVLIEQAQLRECHLSGQLTAAQSVHHFGQPNIRAARANAGY